VSAWYPCALPGSQYGACTSSAWITGSHANTSSSVSVASTVGRAALWQSSQRTGMSALPACANSGQYCATGASTSSSPRSASRFAHAAVAPLVVEKTSCNESLVYGAPVF
jgi:hypothetical protein